MDLQKNIKFYHFYAHKVGQINNVAEKLKAHHTCEFFYLGFFSLLLNIPKMLFSEDFWIFGFNQKSYYHFYKNNILKAFIRYPKLFKVTPLRKLMYIMFELRAHSTKCLILLVMKDKEPGVILIWNGARFPQTLLIEFAKLKNFKMLYFEVGNFPDKIQVDPEGVNYFSSLSQDPEFYLNYKFTDTDHVPETIGVRTNKLKSDGKIVDKPKSYIFVVFQVPSDSQILVLSPWVKSMYHLYDIVVDMVSKIENVNFVIKEHPSFKLKLASEVTPHPRIIFDNWGDTAELIKKSDAVLTVNSTGGLEALVLGKKVITLGLASYNLPGLVLKAENSDQLYQHLLDLTTWSFDNNLRIQFLKYYYNRFLISGTYSRLGQDTVSRILERVPS